MFARVPLERELWTQVIAALFPPSRELSWAVLGLCSGWSAGSSIDNTSDDLSKSLNGLRSGGRFGRLRMDSTTLLAVGRLFGS
jgi:hypothetical protein